MPIIQLPDGQNAEFPDDMPLDHIKSIIKKKYSQSSNWKMQKPNGALGKIADVLDYPASLAGGLATPLVRGGQNLLKSGDAWLQLLKGKSPSEIDTSRFNYLKPNETLSDKVIPNMNSSQQSLSHAGKDIGEMASFIVPGGGSTVPLRVAGSTAAGALTSADPKTGALFGLGGSTLGESLPLVGKGLNTLSQKLMPSDAVKKLTNKIYNNYNLYKNTAKGYYKDITDKIGHFKVTDKPNSFLEMSPENESLLSGRAKKLKEKFSEKPTFNNAHKFQSQLFKDANQKHRSNTGTYEAQDLDDLRSAIKSNMHSWLENNYPHALPTYKMAGEITKTKIKPYEVDNTIKAITRGHAPVLDISPSNLSSALKSFVKSDKVPENIKKTHELYGDIKNINKIIKSSQTAEALSSVLGGSALGYMLGGLGGSAMGAAAAKILSPSVLKLVQSNGLKQALMKSSPSIRKGIVGTSSLVNNLYNNPGD